MKSITGKDPIERLRKARMQLLMFFPFFGELVMRFVFHESKTAGVGTTCIDWKGNFYYHPDWINKMTSTEEVMFEMAHEVMHLVQRATVRFPNGGDHAVWNMAADIKVDSILIESGLKQSAVSAKNITPQLRQKFAGCTTEQIYYALMKDKSLQQQFGICPHKGTGQPQAGEPVFKEGSQAGERGCISGSLHQEKVSQEEIEKFKQYIIAAALKQQGKGNCPAFAENFLAELRKPSVTWRDHLRRTATSLFRGRYTEARPSRRTVAMGIKLPSRTRSPNGAVIMIDTSGSISDSVLTQFLSECAGILKETGCKFLKIFFHDTVCYHIEDYDIKSIHKIKATRGGTSHVDVFEKVKESKEKIGLVVAFTDLYTDFPPNKPDFPVIWAHPAGEGGRVTVPWGKKVEVKLTKDE